jgi:hypothetical protein
VKKLLFLPAWKTKEQERRYFLSLYPFRIQDRQIANLKNMRLIAQKMIDKQEYAPN